MDRVKCDKHSLKEGASWCPDCGADLSLSKEEIESRDWMFRFFSEQFAEQRQKPEFAEKCKGLEFERRVFDGWLSRNAATFSLLIGTTIYDSNGKKTGTGTKGEADANLEDRVKELERKLDKLKSI